MKVYFLQLHLHFSNAASFPPLTCSNFTKTLKWKPIAAVIFQNITHHSIFLSPGYKRVVELPPTNIKPPHYNVNDVNSLGHTILHTYYPDLSEPKSPVRLSSPQRTNIEINNLQPSQILNYPLPFLPYSQVFNKSKTILNVNTLVSLMINI